MGFPVEEHPGRAVEAPERVPKEGSKGLPLGQHGQPILQRIQIDKDSTYKWNCYEYVSGCYLDPDNKNGDGNCNKSRCVGHSIGGALHLFMLLYYYVIILLLSFH